MHPHNTDPCASRVSASVFSADKDPNAHFIHRVMSVVTFRTMRIPDTETRPLCLHVYRVGGIWGEDKIVRADDRRTPRYYLKGIRHAASWQFALHDGGPHGFVVCHVKSPYLGPPMVTTDSGPISIIVGPERHTVQVHRGNGPFGGTYLFRGLDDQEYRWQPKSRLWANKMEVRMWMVVVEKMAEGKRLGRFTLRGQCLNSQNQVVATYRVTLFAIFKDGELRIHQLAQSMNDLLVATCLAMRTPDH